MPAQHAFASIGEEVYHIDQLGMKLTVTDRKYRLTALNLPARASLSADPALWTVDLPLRNFLRLRGRCGNRQFQQKSEYKSCSTRPSVRYGIDLLLATRLDSAELE
ncbi:MAG TPA: hypothetical protein VEF35_09305 [Candidatus Bathyarchaeia archaeon]|nr:hypothetical protein [Candidatus Bathyarchaeia archaeon]